MRSMGKIDPHRPWTRDQDNTLLKMSGTGLEPDRIAAKMRRDAQSVAARLAHLQAEPPSRASFWTESRKARFRQMWADGESLEAISAAFFRSVKNIEYVRYRLGLPPPGARQRAIESRAGQPWAGTTPRQRVRDHWLRVGLSDQAAELRARILTARGAAIEAALLRKQGMNA